MPTEQRANAINTVVCEPNRLHLEPERLVPVAIPENLDQSRTLKADLEAYNIPVQLERREAEMDTEFLGGVPVLVPEQAFEQASEIISLIELNAIDDDEDEFDDFEEFDDDEEEFDEEWDDDDDEDDEYEDEDEDDDFDFDDDLDSDDFDDFD